MVGMLTLCVLQYMYICRIHLQCLDASRPWLCYWILHSLELLDESLSDETVSQ